MKNVYEKYTKMRTKFAPYLVRNSLHFCSAFQCENMVLNVGGSLLGVTWIPVQVNFFAYDWPYAFHVGMKRYAVTKIRIPPV